MITLTVILFVMHFPLTTNPLQTPNPNKANRLIFNKKNVLREKSTN